MCNNEVSVVMPAYNSGKYIDLAIQSVLNQTYDNLELIIVDDCSTDNTVEIIKLKAEEDQRLKFLSHNTNKGVAVARNTGIKAAKGEYIAFLDSDDIWIEKKLEIQLAFMMKNSFAFSFTSYQKVHTNGYEKIVYAKKSISYEQLLYGNLIGCSTVILKRNIISDFTFPLLRKRQDYAFWLKILKEGNTAFGLDEVLTIYNVMEKSLSSNKLKLLSYQWQLFRKIEKKGLIESCYFFVRSIITSFVK